MNRSDLINELKNETLLSRKDAEKFVETFFDAFAVADGGGFERPEEVRAVRRRGALIGSAKQTVRERRAMVDERVAVFFLQMNARL